MLDKIKINRTVVLILCVFACPLIVCAQQPHVAPAPFAPRYANTLPKPVYLEGRICRLQQVIALLFVGERRAYPEVGFAMGRRLED